ncbi:MAG TPA: dienelactone hydrolase family protein [Bacteroidales bacterium]|nr:dienelactone hydrolase family protein [Bacteroidales bacterium]
MKKFSFILLFVFCFNLLSAQEKVSFIAEDGLQVTADLYQVNSERPYIILLHQAGYSRGEYKNTARKMVKFGYNCLAVDLRSGGEVNYIQNHTALVAIQKGYSTDYLSSQKDIEAAIKWVKQRSENPVVLFGSSFSASLSLLMAKDNPDINAVIAFSPGEFFGPEINIKTEIKNLQKPVFVASSKREQPYIKEMFSFVPSTNKTIFVPEKGPGEHGSKSLWNSNPTSKEYWLALTLFFSKIR